MKNLNELKERRTTLGGEIILEFTAGATISDMLTAEKQTVEKSNFLSRKSELAREGKIFVLVAEPGRETMDQAIVNFCKEQARQKRQSEFFKETYELHEIKLEIEAIKKLEADPRIARIRRIVESLSKEDADYIKVVLVNDLTGFTRNEKLYIYQNILNMNIENEKEECPEPDKQYYYNYDIYCDGCYKGGVIDEDCEDYAYSEEDLKEMVVNNIYDNYEIDEYSGDFDIVINYTDDPRCDAYIGEDEE